MTILDEHVLVGLGGKAAKYYENEGYDIPRVRNSSYRWTVPYGTKIKVKVEHLPLRSDVIVNIKCDIQEDGCLGIVQKMYKTVIEQRNIVNKDCCNNGKCKAVKHRLTILSLYGVEHPLQLTPIKEKKIATCFERYGVNNAMQSDIVKETLRENTIAKYGVTHVMYVEEIRNKVTGENAPNWQGGITPLSRLLRNKLEDWIEVSLQASNYKCVITNQHTTSKIKLDVHHLHSFNFLLNLTLQELNFKSCPNVSDYSEIELKLIEDKLISIHYLFGLGVCLRKDIHVLFHRLYGYGNNTPEQFREFKLRWEDGEFLNEFNIIK